MVQLKAFQHLLRVVAREETQASLMGKEMAVYGGYWGDMHPGGGLSD